MSRLNEYKYFINFLQKTKSSQQRKYVLKYATRGQILSIAEIVANYLEGNIQLTNLNNFRIYVKRRKLFRVLGHRGRKSWVKRKQAALELGKVLVKFLLDIGLQNNNNEV